MKKFILQMMTVLVFSLAAALLQGEEPVRDIGSRLELFVDNYLVESMKGTSFRLHGPHDEGPAFAFDAPWENGYATYVTVLDDGTTKRAYYRGNGGITCCAESPDGVVWTKPEYGLFPVNGSSANNIVWIGEGDHNFTPFVDKRPGVPPEERFKALGGIGGLIAFVSPDGIHWKKLSDQPVMRYPGYMFDSQNIAFWSESENKYVCYMRYTIDHQGPNELRTIARAESDDFIHWSASPQLMTFDLPQAEHLYTNQTTPYFRAPHIYLSTAARFVSNRNVLDPETAAKVEVDPAYLKVDTRYWNDCSDAVLLSTRGGYHYDRLFRESLVRPGTDPGNWTSRSNFPAAGIIRTSETEMSIYVVRFYQQKRRALHRCSVRLDGFVSIHAPYETGEWTSRPVRFEGRDLVLNFETGAAGEIAVELLDEAGTPIPGYTLADSPKLAGNFIAKRLVWNGDRHAGELAGRVVRLRFVMKEADLYSLTFRDEP